MRRCVGLLRAIDLALAPVLERPCGGHGVCDRPYALESFLRDVRNMICLQAAMFPALAVFTNKFFDLTNRTAQVHSFRCYTSLVLLVDILRRRHVMLREVVFQES